MSTAISTSTPRRTRPSRLHTARPSFVGIVRGELFKVSRQISTWILGVLLLGAICFPYLVLLASGRIKTEVAHRPNECALHHPRRRTWWCSRSLAAPC